ncbi:MAG: hypothetical protein H6Q00_2164 [Holophagaceae bacterium]|nr:hypothetical protein [Holophagaceae bacterium]
MNEAQPSQATTPRTALFATLPVWLFAAYLLLCCPLPPITDLPQHLSQVHAFWWAVHARDGLYSIHWISPNTLAYWVQLVLCLALPPVLALKSMTLLLITFELAILAWLGHRLNCPRWRIILTSMLILNLDLYWGFFNFILGWPIFILFYEWRLKYHTPAQRATQGILLFILFFAHIFWLFAALLAMTIPLLSRWRKHFKLYDLYANFLPALPVLVLTTLWFFSGYGSAAYIPPEYGIPVLARLSVLWLTDSALGGIQGISENIFTLALIIVIVTQLAQAGRQAWAPANKSYFLLGMAILFAALVIPDKAMMTVRISQRWVPFAVQLLLLAIPALPPARNRWIPIGALACGLFLAFQTAQSWAFFGGEDLTGYRESIQAIPPQSRLLILDFYKFGPRFKHRAYMHLGVMAQPLRGATPSHSFADIPSAWVNFTRPTPYTKRLEWYPEWASSADFLHSDFAFVGGGPEVHAELIRRLPLAPVTSSGIWRLYKITGTPKVSLVQRTS